MQTFLIAGLPRSGLCWLSRFFSVPRISTCLCNGFGQVPSIDLFWAAGEGLGVEFFGNSATMNLMLLPSLLARRPLTKTIWVDRGLDDAMRSAERAGFHLDVEMWAGLEQLRVRYAEHFDAEISFSDLSNESSMRGIWAEALPGAPWNQARWEAYKRKRIVCDRAKTAGTDMGGLARLLNAELEPTPF
jgi:hypothetical protein